MSVHFNADEILSMAARIERNGEAFYRRAAELAVQPEVKETLSDLAEMESGHESLLLTLRQLLAAEERALAPYDPEGQAWAFGADMADRNVFRVRELAASLTGYESATEVLERAMAFERDSIAFFEMLVPLVSDQLGRAKVEVLIDEERDHLARLLRTVEGLRDGEAVRAQVVVTEGDREPSGED